MEKNASLFTSDTATPCDFNIIGDTPDLGMNSKCKSNSKILLGIHSQSKHKYRNAFGDSNIQYHNFDNGDALTFQDKYTTLSQQELQNPYWCLHDPIMMKSYKISTEIDMEMKPHAMYFLGNIETVTKINQVQYQTIVYDDRGMFQAKLMDETQPLLLRTHPKTESNTPIHTGGNMIESHFWIEIPLKLDNQIIQIKALVCDSECPYNIVLDILHWHNFLHGKIMLQSGYTKNKFLNH